MQIEPMSNEDALNHLRSVERSACSEMPSFVSAPHALAPRRVGNETCVAFECIDHANEATYIVELPFGPLPSTRDEGHARLHEMSAEALNVADRIAKAVFN